MMLRPRLTLARSAQLLRDQAAFPHGMAAKLCLTWPWTTRSPWPVGLQLLTRNPDPELQSPRTKLHIHDHDTLLDLNSSNMFTTVSLPPWPVLSVSHDEQHVVKNRPSLYTTRHLDAVVLAKALGPHSHEVAVSTSGNERGLFGGGGSGHEGGAGGSGGDGGRGDSNLRRGGGRGDGRAGGRVRGAAGTAQGGAAGAAADK